MLLNGIGGNIFGVLDFLGTQIRIKSGFDIVIVNSGHMADCLLQKFLYQIV